MLASQFAPGGICFPKRGVHRTGTISTGCQLSALLPNELGEPAVQLIALAALQHADVLLNDALCGFCSRPSGSHSGCLVAATCICDITIFDWDCCHLFLFLLFFRLFIFKAGIFKLKLYK